MRFLSLLFVASALSFAQSWSGYLVDSGCYSNDLANRNRDQTTADRDMNMVLRQCSPDARTKNFALVLPDWSRVTLDAAGNAKAVAMLRNAEKKTPIQVKVTGQRTDHDLKVTSLQKMAQ